MKLHLSNVRLAFPKLFEPETFNGEGKPAYSAAFIIDPKHPDMAKVKAAIEQVAAEKWTAKAKPILAAILAKDDSCLHNGDLKAQYEGFEGNHYLSSRCYTRPLVINADKTPLAAQDGRPYAGCYVNASIEIWAQDNGFGKRVNATLKGVQFLRAGDAFAGGAPASEDEFDDVSNTGEDLV